MADTTNPPQAIAALLPHAAASTPHSGDDGADFSLLSCDVGSPDLSAANFVAHELWEASGTLYFTGMAKSKSPVARSNGLLWPKRQASGTL